jgi:hypothetical protein
MCINFFVPVGGNVEAERSSLIMDKFVVHESGPSFPSNKRRLLSR